MLVIAGSVGCLLCLLLSATSVVGGPIHDAVKRGDETVVRQILKTDPSALRARTAFGRTPLHLAAVNGHGALVDVLLAAGADLEAGDEQEQTPLHLAAWAGQVDILVKLLDRGANIQALDRSDGSPLWLAANRTHLPCVERLLARGAKLDFYTAVARNDTNLVAQFLTTNPALANPSGVGGQTPLHLAAWHDSVAVMQLLLASGANAMAVDSENNTVLHEAALRGAVSAGELILARGANIQARNRFGLTPLHHAASAGPHYFIAELLTSDALTRRTWDVSRLPWEKIAREHATMTRLLLAKGADPVAKDEWGRTPLHLASACGLTDTVAALLERGADPNASANQSGTPLHRAAWYGHAAVVKLLLDAKSNVNARDQHGVTPLHHAAARGHHDIAESLLRHGADPAAVAQDSPRFSGRRRKATSPLRNC